MKIVVSANGSTWDAPASPIFGRCPVYVFVDTDSMMIDAVENEAQNAAGGAGIQAAQFVVDQGAKAVVSGNLGPNAFQVLNASQVPVYLHTGGSVRQVVEAFKAGALPQQGGANVAAHSGMGGSTGMGLGRRQTASVGAASVQPSVSREQEIEALRESATALRKQLAEIVDRLDQLEKGE